MLQRLLGDIPVADFLRNRFHRLPFAYANARSDWVALAEWSTAASILQQPSLDLLIGRPEGRWPGTTVPTPEEARALMAEGYTLSIRHAERHDPGIAAIAESFRRDFAAPIDVQLFCTPAHAPGFGWHYDPEDVFVLQTQGSKHWELRKNTVNPWPLIEAIPQNMRYEREIMPLMRCTLAVGDWLYIPGGYWHRTQAADVESISLSVGVLSPNGIDAFDFLRTKLLDSLQWRQRLPTVGEAQAGTDEDLRKRFHEMFAALAEDAAKTLTRDEFIDSWIARQRSAMAPPH
jgi:50S ribosomal protein L16 3-hydroxylase